MEEFGSMSCSRSQTVPNMSSLVREVREVTSPDSLLSDRQSPPDSPLTVSKTPDSVLSDRPPHRRTGNLLLTAWQAADQTEEAWTGMMNNENGVVRDRLGDLERRVGQQNDEIVCLKATLAECLRRLNSLEVDRDHVEISTTPSRSVSVTQTWAGTNGGSKIPLRRSERQSRRISHNSDSAEKPVSAPIRRSVMYHSNTSINSDTSLLPGHNSTPRLHTPAVGPRKMTGSMGRLHRKWRSTSDFDPAPALSVYRRSTVKSTAGSSLSFRSSQSPYGSQQNIDRSPQYCSEEGQLRVSIKGRLVSLLCPDSLRDSFNIERILPAPGRRLRLDWVYGYRGRDARNNLHLLPTGEMVYFLAAVVVLYNPEEQTQRHYLGHTEDIKCLALHPNKLTVATGQGPGFYKREGEPHIRVWNSVSLQTIAVLGLGELTRAVSCLSFSRTDGGSYLVSVDETPEHNLTVWDWARSARQLDSKVSSDTVVSAEFHPTEDGCIVTCGKGHVNFWQIDPSYSAMSRKTGVLDPRDKPKYFTSLAFSFTGDLITGDSNGNIFVWGRGYNAVTKAMWKVHEGPIFSICVLKDGSIVTGGGRDGRVVMYDSSYSPTGAEAQLPQHLGCVRTLSQGQGAQLLLGTTRNSVLTGNLELSFQEVMLGHSEEVTALAARPSQSQFLTAGHDRLLHLWDSLSHGLVWSNDVGEQIQSACFSPDGEVIVAGTVTGKWVVLDSRTRELHGLHQDGAEPITSVSFSPDGHKLALSSRAAVQVYRVEDDYRTYTRTGRCLAQAAFLPHMDWSEDSEYIQANTQDREVVVVKASLGRLVTDTDITRNIVWTTSDCLLSWGSLGVWSGGRDPGQDITSAARSHEGDLLAAGSERGEVRLYQYPASLPQCGHHQYPGHTGGVARLAFLADDTRLVSVGGKDSAILQWEIE